MWRSLLKSCLFLIVIRAAEAQSISAGASHGLTICSDSSLHSWGRNGFGELGDSTNITSLVSVPAKGPGGWVQLSSGGVDHSVALRKDGTVWCWGQNISGQLGDCTAVARNYPVQVHGPGNQGYLTGIKSIANGHLHHHTMVMKQDSTIWAWGFNNFGQLGDCTQVMRYTPVRTKVIDKAWKIAAGDIHSLALLYDSTVWAWGKNVNGQLGDSTTVDKLYPVKVKGLSGIIDIHAGEMHSMALRKDSTVWMWGLNYYGQLGDGTNFNSAVPVQVMNLDKVIAISSGEMFGLAIRDDSTLWAWGYNYFGQLGDGSMTDRWFPVQVQNLSGVTEAAGGRNHTLAKLSDGSIWSWGMATWGQTGTGGTGVPPCYCLTSPVQVWGPCDIATAHDQMSLNPDFSLYPNPSSEEVYIQCESYDQIFEINVFDVLGERVLSRNMLPPFRFSVNNLTPGLYFVHVAGANVIYNATLVVVSE